ncbi:MAG: DUF6925 family protein [Sporichthyaceae bacterium]
MAHRVLEVLSAHLARADTGWSMGSPGAVAEFLRTSDEPVTARPGEMVSGRGGIRLRPEADVRLVAYETPAGPHGHWNHTVALCVPTAAAGPARTTVTDLGPDGEALREWDRASHLVDLGLGRPAVDVCVRVADPDLLARLRAAAGTSLFDDPHLVGAVIAAGPHRVFTTACGRVEVYSPIPPSDGRSPDGPHTHLLPKLLRAGRTHPATAPIPERYLPVAAFYPAHPVVDRTGTPRSWDQTAHDAFAVLLASFGDAEQLRLKDATWRAAREGTPLPAPVDPPGRAAVAVALRQLVRLEPERAAAVAALGGQPTVADLLDPDRDRHGG